MRVHIPAQRLVGMGPGIRVEEYRRVWWFLWLLRAWTPVTWKQDDHRRYYFQSMEHAISLVVERTPAKDVDITWVYEEEEQ